MFGRLASLCDLLRFFNEFANTIVHPENIVLPYCCYFVGNSPCSSFDDNLSQSSEASCVLYS